jgi:endonuclease YncB( thermonuclease family)
VVVVGQLGPLLHNLDGDGDGKACEDLPCPCGSGDGGGGGGGGDRKRDNTQRARVKRVIDGDTIEVRFSGKVKDVRLIGIDTPEVFGGKECGGEQASRSMKKMLDRRERVKLIRDRTQDNRDRFGRLLRYVEDGRKDVGKAQVGKGWAKVVKFDGRFKRIRSYRKAQRRAKSNDRGVWSLCGGDFHLPVGFI